MLDGFEPKETKVRPSLDFRLQTRLPLVSDETVVDFSMGQTISLEDLENIVNGLEEDESVSRLARAHLEQAAKVVDRPSLAAFLGVRPI